MTSRANKGSLVGMLACLVLPATAVALPPGDPARGAQIYERCIACHAIDRDRTGPRHAGLLGRSAGAIENFRYSAAMKNAGAAGLVWSEDSLDRFLENPTKFLPGTRMGYAGVKDGQERADLIAYLKQFSRH